MTVNTKKLWEYLQENANRDLTAADIASELEMSAKGVNGTFTMAIQKGSQHAYGYRDEAEIELPDGTHQTVKYLRLNDAGLHFDLSSVELTN